LPRFSADEHGVVIHPGELRRHRALGTTALYRVASADGDLVSMEVVRAPGLLPGTVVRLTTPAVAAMEMVEESETVDVALAATLDLWSEAS
jgi:hypothetical protein